MCLVEKLAFCPDTVRRTRLLLRAPRTGKRRKRGKKLSRREQAEMYALVGLGTANAEVERRSGIHPTTIDRYLKNREAYCDARMEKKIEQIKEKEIWDLTVLNVRAKDRLHDLAESMNPIEAIALMDRSFQQIRLLEGKSTANISTMSKIIQEANAMPATRQEKTIDVDVESVK